MAQQLWPNQDPIGRRIHFGGITDKDPWETVVGIVGRVKQYALDSDSRIALYLPQTQYPTRAIGANTSIFSIVNALLLRPLRYRDASRLVILWNRSPGLNITEDWFPTAQYFDIKNGHRGFEQVAIAIGGNWHNRIVQAQLRRS